MDLIPGLSQLKSAVQIITGDVKGAERTQERFWHESPAFSQITTVAYAATGNTSKTAERGIKTMGAIADGVPVVGHAKGIIHYACGDEDGGDRAMKAASRTTVVLGAGAGGMLAGGPIGAMAAGAYAGAATDTVYSAVSGKNEGLLKAIENAVENPNAGNVLDAAFIPVADAATGYAGGQMANAVKAAKSPTTTGNSKILKSSKISAQEASSWSKGGSSSYSSYASKGAAYVKPVPFTTSAAAAVRSAAAVVSILPPAAVAIGCAAGATVSVHNRGITPEKRKQRGQYEKLMQTELRETSNPKQKESFEEVSIEEELRELIKQIAQQCAANYEVGLSVLMKSVEVQTWNELVDLAEQCRTTIKKLLKLIKKKKPREESDSDSSSDKDKKKIRCLQWNLCGIRAQLTARNLGFLIYLKFMNPDVILLNELKMERGVEDLARAIGYEAVVSPSISPNGRPMRGSAILFKNAQMQNWFVAPISNPLAQDMEYCWADLKFGDTTRRFVSVYLRELNKGEFPILIDAFNRVAVNQWTVIGGDLNLRKEDYLPKFNNSQYFDALKPTWKTNRSPTNQTAIDYILSRPECQGDILSHRPFPIGGKMVHFPIIFEIEEDLNADCTWCTDKTCFLCISSKLTQVLLKSKDTLSDIVH